MTSNLEILSDCYQKSQLILSQGGQNAPVSVSITILPTELNLYLNSTKFTHNCTPYNLVITLDRTLSYKHHLPM